MAVDRMRLLVCQDQTEMGLPRTLKVQDSPLSRPTAVRTQVRAATPPCSGWAQPRQPPSPSAPRPAAPTSPRRGT